MKLERLPNRRIACAERLAALALLVLPLASTATQGATPDSLAVAESLLQRCTAMTNAKADVVRQQVALLEQGVTPEELAKLRSSDVYQAAYQASSDMLSKVDEDELKTVCAVQATAQP